MTGAVRLVPPTWPAFVPPAAVVVQTVRMPVLGSAMPEMSGATRPGHGALASTPAPFCHGGRAKTREHQLPPPLHVVDVLHWAEFDVEYVLVPPVATTFGLS